MSEHAPDTVRLLADARAGSREALGQLLEAFRAYALLIAERELDPELRAKGGASDLVQETLLDAIHDFAQFQGATAKELRRWLRRLLLHNLVDFARQYRETGKRQVGREVALNPGELGPPLTANTPSPSTEAITHEQVRALQEGLGRLPDEYRQVILWRYQEQRSFEEIGRDLGLTPNAARKLWLRAVQRLQQETGSAP